MSRIRWRMILWSMITIGIVYSVVVSAAWVGGGHWAVGAMIGGAVVGMFGVVTLEVRRYVKR